MQTMCVNLHNKINHNISFSKRNSGTQGQRPLPGILPFLKIELAIEKARLLKALDKKD